MAEGESFVHEVHLVYDGHRVRKIILRAFRIAESVLHPCGDGVDEIHAQNRNQHEKNPDPPVVDKHSPEISVVTRHSPQHSPSVLFVAFRLKVGVWRNPKNGPNVVRHVPEQIDPAGSVVAHRVAGVVESGVLSMVKTYMRGPAELRNVPVKKAQEEFEVPAKDLIVFIGKEALAPMGFQVAVAEHPPKPLKLEPVKCQIESNDQQKCRLPH